MTGSCDFGREPRAGALFFDVAQKNWFSGQQGFQRFFPRFRAYAVNDPRALLFEGLRNVPGHALAIGHAHHEEAFPGNLEEIAHAGFSGVFHATEKSTLRMRLSVLLILPDII